MTRIKLCGLTRLCDIEEANSLLPDYIGFVFAAKSKRYVSPEVAGRLREALNPSVCAVGVFVKEAPEYVAGLLNSGVIDLAQLHGGEDEQYIEQLRSLTDKPVIRAFCVDGPGDIAQAKVIAQAIMDEGWEFASHTWGHISVTGADAGTLQVDNEKWINNVSNIVGPTDTIIFAHGNDIGDWQEYSPDNPKYNYYRSAGYYFYCNVDGSVPYWVQIRGNYVRQGRINMDGYMLYQASTGQTDVLNSLIDPVSVFDSRRPTPVIANGQG